MTYVEGGNSVCQVMSLSKAKMMASALTGLSAVGVVISAVVAGIGGAIGALYFGSTCYNAYQALEDAKWYIKQGYKSCTVRTTYIAGKMIITGMYISNPRK